MQSAFVPGLGVRHRFVPSTARRCSRRRTRMTAEAGDRARPPRVFATASVTTNSESPQPPSQDALPARLFGDSLSQSLPRPTEKPSARPKTKTRIRQHLNPLAARWQGAIALDTGWFARSFADASLPLVVDVGCGKGRFAERLAARDAARNILGLEIRAPLVDEANARAQARGLANLSFLACNANVSLAHALARAPAGALDAVLLQFCDPWFKKRHAKRRMVDGALVAAVHDALRKAAEGRAGRRTVFVQSDVRPLAEEMRERFDAHAGFRRDDSVQWTKEGWLEASPLGEKTEREICVERRGEPVYRALFTLAGPGWEVADGGAVRGEVDRRGDGDVSDGSEELSVDIFAED